jgi:geranylgeranyl pyrophosphate synthase
MLTLGIENALKRSTHHRELLEVMNYAVLPAGKMFRPRLVEAMCLDLDGKVSEDAIHLASAIEIHHAYTLVHDDLPSMDNDLIRRGKPSTHAHFGEWKAVLAGDALLIQSFDELMNIKSVHLRALHRVFSWCTGAKGLISGQFLDLGAKGDQKMEQVIRIHELKTGRLIQVATIGSYLLSSKKKSLRSMVEYMRLGREIGVSFQLLDDLSELTDPKVSDHEKQINPFLISPVEALNALRISHLRLTAILFKHRLDHLSNMLSAYFKNNQKHLLENFSVIEANTNEKFVSSDFKAWMTNFV